MDLRLRIRVLKERIARKIAEHPEAAGIALIGQTTNITSTTGIDLSPMVSVISEVIPLFVIVAVVKILFKSFKDVA
ncbi:MAG TPA: hypothetical protein EYP33_01090 [Pyrodictium sp.]|nr:hypothetical protein [Pyrodictium sp.]